MVLWPYQGCRRGRGIIAIRAGHPCCRIEIDGRPCICTFLYFIVVLNSDLLWQGLIINFLSSIRLGGREGPTLSAHVPSELPTILMGQQGGR